MERQELADYIEAARSGDGNAITQLVKEYHSLIRKNIREQLGEDCDYKPIEIHALSNAFAHMDTLRDETEFESWLLSYVRQEVLRSPLAATIDALDKTQDTAADSGEIPFGMDGAQTETAEPLIRSSSSPMQAEEEPQPKLKKRRKPVRDEDEEEDDDDDEAFSVPGWLLGTIITLLAVIALGLILYLLTPKVYDKTFGLIPFLPKAETAPTVSPTPTPQTTPLPTPTISAAPSSTPEPSTTPTPSAEATPTPSSSAKIGIVTVKVHGLNIRSSASTDAGKVGSTTNGQTYDVFSTTTAGGYTWYQIGEGKWIADNGSWVTYTAN